ncbi:uncharacterized protein LOC124705672 [Lolium rigidum]|uniref:uncharacterized protein LOC124705672 n=1 Tax=Lolium rigidum TaxID=89674 RepID=UPI001F5CB8C1|nr:uncharacterized protein LOC124705672 [Lolium rigidum]
METSTIVLFVVVGFLGLGSTVLGFIAESTKLTRGDIKVSMTKCIYPANPAFALGLVAAILLLVAQIIVSAVTGCCGCCKPRGGGFSGSKRTISIVFAVLSWIAAALAELYFLQGAAWNAPVTREAAEGCYYARNGVFRRAALLSIVATVLGIKSYLLLRAAAAQGPVAILGTPAAGEPKHDEIAMGHPVAPVYGQAPYGHYPPPPTQGYGHYPPPAQGHGHFPPAATPAQQHAQAV